MAAKEAFKKSPCGGPIPASLQKHVDYLTILIDGAPEVLLFTIDLHEYLINVEGIAAALVLPLQSPSVYCAKPNTPKPDDQFRRLYLSVPSVARLT